MPNGRTFLPLGGSRRPRAELRKAVSDLGNRYCALRARGPRAMANTRVTVFGGSGFIGRHLAAELVNRGAKVRIAARHSDQVSDPRVEVVVADVLDDSSVASAVEGSSAVINLVG